MPDNYRDRVCDFYDRRKRLPSYGELAQLFGFKSKNAAYKLADKLIEAGIIARDSSGKLIPGNMLSGLPLAGVVEAGLPTPVEAALLETTDLDELLVKSRASSYLLRVKGESMIEAGIYEGDLVLVDTKQAVKEGDIVIAEVDGDWTMKYLRAKNGKNYLEPANRRFKPIYPKHSFRIAAVVRAVIRKY